MKKLFLIFGLYAGVTAMYSQALTPQVIASSGTSFTSADASLDFTIGELAITSLTTSSNTITQGFHQPQITYASLQNYNTDFVFTLFPNPTEQFITVSTTNETELQLNVFDANGKTIFTSSVFSKTITVDMQTLAAGTYKMRIANKAGDLLHSYTIIKKNNQ